MLTFRPSPAVRAVVLEATNRLYGWQQPLLPENLCLLRDDDEPVLVSIAHEGDSHLVLDDDELSLDPWTSRADDLGL